MEEKQIAQALEQSRGGGQRVLHMPLTQINLLRQVHATQRLRQRLPFPLLHSAVCALRHACAFEAAWGRLLEVPHLH